MSTMPRLRAALVAVPLCLSIPAAIHAQVRPQDDYYTYVNADWLAKTPIPENLPGLDNFTELLLRVNGQVRDALETMRTTKKPLQPHERKLVDLYISYLDKARRDRSGVEALRPELDLIANAKDARQLALAFAEFQKLGIGGPFVFAVTVDPKDATRNTLTVIQYGLGTTQAVLVGDDERSTTMRGLYREHVANLLRLAGIPDAEAAADGVLELERKLARIQWTPEQNRDPQKAYNPLSAARLRATLSHFPVNEMLSVLGFPTDRDVVVRQPTYLEALDRLLVETPVGVWQSYLRARLLSERTPILSQAFEDELNAYQVKQGASAKPLDDWLRAVLFLSDEVDMLVGRVYVEHYFSASALVQIEKIVREVKEEFGRAIAASTLFSETTRKEATEKLEKMRFYLGYPKRWKDYGTLQIDPTDLAGNVRRIALFNHEKQKSDLKEPIDPDEWLASPTQVNAFYQPSANRFMLMAAILQPPFFDLSWSDARKMGGIGFIVGHEVGHGFDDQGSRYDAAGNLRNWWSDEDRAKFAAIAMRAVKQADAYEILPGHHLNGRLELGEILGDLNGLHIAHAANVRIAKAAGVDIDKAEREFFEQAAQAYRGKLREQVQLKFLEIDGHPPGIYRVNGTFPHLDAFHAIYRTKPGDGMYLPPEERLRIW